MRARASDTVASGAMVSTFLDMMSRRRMSFGIAGPMPNARRAARGASPGASRNLCAGRCRLRKIRGRARVDRGITGGPPPGTSVAMAGDGPPTARTDTEIAANVRASSCERRMPRFT